MGLPEVTPVVTNLGARIAPYWKAVTGFVAPGIVVLVGAVIEGSPGDSHITGAEWVTAAAACFLTSYGVWQTPNRDPLAKHQDESVQPADAGE